MRELIFKNMTTTTSKKRDISVEEIVQRNGRISSTKKRSLYFVRGIHNMHSQEELDRWIKRRREDSTLNKKFFHILRKYSEKDGEDKLVCKMRGSFHVISGQSVINIVFVHAIKISLRAFHA